MLDKNQYWIGLDIGSTTIKIAVVDSCRQNLVYSEYRRHNARQAGIVAQYLREVQKRYPTLQFRVAVCGSGGMPFAQALKVHFVQEVVANSIAIKKCYPDVRTAVELGGQDAKVIFFRQEESTGNLVASDLRMNGSCAGGTGAFIDQMAELLSIPVESFDELAGKGKLVYDISGRCGVFAKTDIQPLLNQGADKADIALSCLHAIAKQTIGGLAQGLTFSPPVIFEGGPLIFNNALVEVFRERLGLSRQETVLPVHAENFIAYGTALSLGTLFQEAPQPLAIDDALIILERFEKYRPQKEKLEKGKPFFKSPRHQTHYQNARKPEPFRAPKPNPGVQRAYLGIDAGSTTSKFALLDEENRIIDSFYANNVGDPLRTLKRGLSEVAAKYKNQGIQFDILALGATGYGEALTASAFGADYHTVETVAHAEAARRFEPGVSFILDLGGQDMKAIWINQGIITKILLNEACSAGCGSFLETYAKSLKIKVDDIAQLAFSSKQPSHLGSRCTVFMHSSIITEQRDGKSAADIMAGLCRSVVENFFTKVGRIQNADALGKNIVVQGGTFKNDAVLRSFEEFVKRPVIRPPYPGLMGAVGAALLAKQERASQIKSKGEFQSQFIGLDKIDSFEFTSAPGQICPFCQNSCNRTVLSFSNGGRFVTGNRCEKGEILGEANDKATKDKLRVIRAQNRSVPDMIEFYRKELVNRPAVKALCPSRGIIIGLPRALDFWRNMPFWHTLYSALGFEVAISNRSTYKQFERGLSTVASDTICFPAKIVHGHVLDLIHKKVDRIFMPVMISRYTYGSGRGGKAVCSVVSGYPMVIPKNIDKIKDAGIYLDNPTFDWKSPKLMEKQLSHFLKETHGIAAKTAKAAIALAETAMKEFQSKLKDKNREIQRNLKPGQFAAVLACRPYQLDELINHNINRHFVQLGIPVLTMDGIDHGKYDIGRSRIEIANGIHARMLSSAMAVSNTPNLELVQITSFGCGHDAVIGDEIVRIMDELGDKSVLQLKLDEGEVQGPIKIRIRSFVETIAARQKAGLNTRVPRKELASPFPQQFTKEDKFIRKILVPNLSPAFSMLATRVLEKKGYKAQHIAIADERAIALGKKYTHNDICFPAQINIGEFLAHLEKTPEQQDEVCLGLAKNCENCRAGQYAALARKALDEAGYEKIPIVTTGDDNKAMHPGFKTDMKFQVNMVWGMAMVDAIEAMFRSIRPYEINCGQTRRVYDTQLASITEAIKYGRTHALRQFDKTVTAFNGIPADRSIRKPRVGLLGEIFLKYHPAANGYIEDYLVKNGMETLQPPMMDFFRRGDLIRTEKRKRNMMTNPLMAWLVGTLSEGVYKKALKSVGHSYSRFKYYEPHKDVYGLAEHVKGFMDLVFKVGEGWLIASELIEWANHGINSFIIVQPFGCMPNHISGRGMSKALKEQFPHVQILCLDFDPDTSFANIENRLQMVIINAREMEKAQLVPRAVN